MDVAARGVAGRALVADLFAGLDPLADPDGHVAEVSVDAAVAVAVVDDDHVRQIAPHVANVEDMEVRPEVADPADLLVEMAAGRQDDAIVRRPDRCAAERGHVDPVVEELAVVDPLPAGDCLERQRDAPHPDRPDIAGQGCDGRSPALGERERAVGVGCPSLDQPRIDGEAGIDGCFDGDHRGRRRCRLRPRDGAGHLAAERLERRA